MTTERVFVYELAPAEELEDRADAVRAALASLAGPGAAPWFESLPAGCFRWERGAPVREAPSLGTIRTPVAARTAATQFMRQANTVARGRAPFPLDSLRADVTRRLSKPAPGWLSAWTVWLPFDPDDRSRRAPVLGATMELRIGADGLVSAVSSRARPWVAFEPAPVLDWRPAENHDDGGREHRHTAEEEKEPPLVYLCDPPTEALRFFSPSWVIEPEDEESHHARRFWPACEHTVLPEITVEDFKGESTLRAQVLRAGQTTEPLRHGGDWTLRWGVASMLDTLAGNSTISERSSISLDAGLYFVALDVIHNATGARRSTTTQLVVPGVEAYDIPLDDGPAIS